MHSTPSAPLERQVISILAANREDSYATQHKRAYILADAARTLHEKFGLQKWVNVGEKHIAHVVETWKAENNGSRAIDEKLSNLRWLVRKIGKAKRHVDLRFREAALFRTHRDFDGDRVWVERGTKGGRPRYLYVHNAQQAAALARGRAYEAYARCCPPHP